MRLAPHDASKPLQVALNRRTPLPKARPRQVRRQLAVQPPGAPLGVGEIGEHWPPCDLEPIPHARQQPVELLVAQLDLPREKLTDARLPHSTETRRLRLAGNRVEQS